MNKNMSISKRKTLAFVAISKCLFVANAQSWHIRHPPFTLPQKCERFYDHLICLVKNLFSHLVGELFSNHDHFSILLI
jgi:hypothetical protein